MQRRKPDEPIRPAARPTRTAGNAPLETPPLYERIALAQPGTRWNAPRQAEDPHAPPTIAFYYGSAHQTAALQQFDIAVIEPDHGYTPTRSATTRTQWLAYISIGEALSTQSYFQDIPRDWLIGQNHDWGSWIIDQSAVGWPDFLCRKIAWPLQQRHFDGFFLDTMDSYRLLDTRTHSQETQKHGLVRAIAALRHTFPNAVILTNRGFELLPELHRYIDAIAFESLYRGWDQQQTKYVDVSQQDRDWLLAQTTLARSYGLATLAIDYCPPCEPQLSRALARWIRQHGIIPYVGDGYLQTINTDILQLDSASIG